MIPKFDTVVQQNVDRGLRKFYAGVQSFRKVPSVINEFTVEPYNSEEMDAIAFNNLLNPEIGFERADELGSGKGSVEYWIAKVQPGRVLYEIEGVSEASAREAFRLAAAKLPVSTVFAARTVL